jgi:hypothetical protein
MKKFISTLTCVCVIAACGTAFAQQHEKFRSGPYTGPRGPITSEEAPAAAPFYTNLVANPCVPGQKYDSNDGFLVLGPNNCYPPTVGITQWLAYPFIAGHAGAVSKVTLSITDDAALCTPTSNKITVAIYSDACTVMPITQIGSAVVANVPAAPPALASANFASAGVTLVAGTQYWLVVTTSAAASQNAVTAVWWEATANQGSVNINDGSGWQFGSPGGPGGFQVQ